MQHDQLKTFLSNMAAERLAILSRLEAGARVVGHYDFNNTYQYVIAREETHLAWLQSALAEIGEPLPAASGSYDVPALAGDKRTAMVDAGREVLGDDARRLGAFVAKWTPGVHDITHARHRRMLDVILGESAEHQRLFEQAAQGFEDVLGRRSEGVARVGGVLPTRWQE